MQRFSIFALTALCVLTLTLETRGADVNPAPAELEFFENRIRPVLIDHCYECHSEDSEEIQGAFRVDSRSSIRRGGRSGRAVVPNQVDDSLLLAAISYRHDELKMPPTGKLPDHVIEDFVKWIEMGAPDPRLNSPVQLRKPTAALNKSSAPVTRGAEPDIEKRRQFWAYQTPRPPSIPPVSQPTWPYNDIDRFVLAKLDSGALNPNPDADKHTLLRRIYVDLTGMLPTPEEVEAFVGDPSPDAYARVVDRLLASDHFGQRWARHWLDLAQYADTLGFDRVFPNNGAWRYRDYVIRSLNDDKPLDRFVIEQLAGDLLPYDDRQQRADQMVATQFLTQGPMNLINQFKEQLRMDIVDNQVRKVGRSLLGLTLGCARCHDHKFDPLPQTDYYALAGILQNVQVLNGLRGNSGVFSDWIRQPVPESPQQQEERERRLAEHNAKLAALAAQIEINKQTLAELEGKRASQADVTAPGLAATQEAGGGQPDKFDQPISELTKKLEQLEKQRTDLKNYAKANPFTPPTILAASEPTESTNARVNLRGNPMVLGDEIQRGFLRVLPGSTTPDLSSDSSGRLELAEWVTNPDNPLFARVFVNRVWHHLFGTGIVRTVDNFGERGDRPSHPELLDFLAVRFIDGGYRVKELIREVVLSRTYRLSSRYDEQFWTVDPDNRMLWRHRPRRLDSESIRDSLLKVSNNLSECNGGSTLPSSSWLTGVISEFAQINDLDAVDEKVLLGRSIFLPISRNNRPFKGSEPLIQFDFPAPDEITGARQASNVPTQSLFMMNSPFVRQRATEFAEQLLGDRFESDAARVEYLYLAAYGRPCDADELRESIAFVEVSTANVAGESASEKRAAAWTELCHAILMSTEFLTHD